MQGVDYSWARPDLACLKRNGKDFVVRYFAGAYSGKVVTPAETGRIIAAGLKLVITYEDRAGDMLNGWSAGVSDGHAARASGAAIGMPTHRPIYFALDVDPNPLSQLQIAAIRSYLSGAASVLGRHRIGIYGGYRAIELFVPDDAPWGWQTYAWSRGRISSKAHMRQYRNSVTLCGGEVDLNETYRDDFGQWPISVSVPEAKKETDDMKIADCAGKPALLVGGPAGIQFLNVAQRSALRKLDVPAVLVTPDQHDALVSLREAQIKVLQGAVDSVLTWQGAIEDSGLRGAIETELNEHDDKAA